MRKGMKANERYQKIADWFRQHPTAGKSLELSYIWLPRIVEAGYLLLLLLAWQRGMEALLKYITIPAVVFGLVSVMRHIWDFPRPYEQGREALIPKEKRGHSFPSRHAASAAVIAWVWLDYNIAAGSFFGIAALLIAASRVLAGVHYVRDVAAGIVLAVLLGIGLFYFF